MDSTESPNRLDASDTIKLLTLHQKVQLLSGKDTWTTSGIEELNIPSIRTSDGPHGVRGTAFFNGPKGCLLPSATGMGATFNANLMHSVGEMLAAECREKDIQVLLAPTVCLQRSPLIGRGFEAFGEDPVLSGLLAASYINGVQRHGVAVSLKHYAAHDQSTMSLEDSICVSERVLREVHLLPFQLAVKHSSPWSIMTAYHQVNGIHSSEHHWLIEEVLRKEWGWDGLVMSDWFGVYSTAEAINAGLDLEMPGPAKWRGENLKWAVQARKVRESTIDKRVRNVLNLVARTKPGVEYRGAFEELGDSHQKRQLCRQVSGEAVVLLKNAKQILPLDPAARRTYGLIGSAISHPAVSGGGSADLIPHYINTPMRAICDVVGEDQVRTAIGSHSHLFTPLLTQDVTIPGTDESGYFLEWFTSDPRENEAQQPLSVTKTEQAQMYFADSLPKGVTGPYWLRVTATYTAPKSATVQFGLCVVGRGRMFIGDEEVIDLFTSQPPKTVQTPMFDTSSMEVTADVRVEAGRRYNITVLFHNGGLSAAVGAANAGGLRIGCCEKLDPVAALKEAVELARSVDVPVIITGLNADYESEAVDRKDLNLPAGVNTLIESVLKANPNTIVVTQSGCPIAMPWVENAATLLHAWFGGQEAGNAIADVLFGKLNPSGRLPITFPKCIEDTPAFLNFGKGMRVVMYGEGVYIGYRYYEKLRKQPLFYFGYGLSYTTFHYTNLRVPHKVRLDDQEATSFTVEVDVQNTGSRDGFEVIQIYVEDVKCHSTRPRKELKAFDKVFIKSGETATSRISLNKYALSHWSEEHQCWLAEKGLFRLFVSRSADPQDEVLSSELVLEEDYFWTGV